MSLDPDKLVSFRLPHGWTFGEVQDRLDLMFPDATDIHIAPEPFATGKPIPPPPKSNWIVRFWDVIRGFLLDVWDKILDSPGTAILNSLYAVAIGTLFVVWIMFVVMCIAQGVQ